MSLAGLLQNRLLVRGVLTVAGAAVIGAVLAAWMIDRRQVNRCSENLEVIHSALLEYHQQSGHLPELAFFPDDAQLDPDSLYAQLAPFGLLPTHCLCPSAPPALRETGMTYIWNVSLNGAVLDQLPDVAWVLVEVHALSGSVRPPHGNRYNTLFSDGTVELLSTPPAMP